MQRNRSQKQYRKQQYRSTSNLQNTRQVSSSFHNQYKPSTHQYPLLTYQSASSIQGSRDNRGRNESNGARDGRSGRSKQQGRRREEERVYKSKYTTILQQPELEQSQYPSYHPPRQASSISASSQMLAMSQIKLKQQLEQAKNETIYKNKQQQQNPHAKQDQYFGLLAARNMYNKLKHCKMNNNQQIRESRSIDSYGHREKQNKNENRNINGHTDVNSNSRSHNKNKVSSRNQYLMGGEYSRGQSRSFNVNVIDYSIANVQNDSNLIKVVQNLKKEYTRLTTHLEQVQRQNSKIREANMQLIAKNKQLRERESIKSRDQQKKNQIFSLPSSNPQKFESKDNTKQSSSGNFNYPIQSPYNVNINKVKQATNVGNLSVNVNVGHQIDRQTDALYTNFGNNMETDIIRSLTELSQGNKSTTLDTCQMLKKARNEILIRDKTISQLQQRLLQISAAITSQSNPTIQPISPLALSISTSPTQPQNNGTNGCKNCIKYMQLKQQLQVSISQYHLLQQKIVLLENQQLFYLYLRFKQVMGKLEYFMAMYQRQRDLILQKEVQIDMHMKYTRKIMTELGYWKQDTCTDIRNQRVWYQHELTMDQATFSNTGTLPQAQDINQLSLMPKPGLLTLGQIPISRPTSRTQPYQPTYPSSASTSAAVGVGVGLSSSIVTALKGSWLNGEKII